MGTILSTAVRNTSESVGSTAQNIPPEAAVGLLLTVPFVLRGISKLVSKYQEKNGTSTTKDKGLADNDGGVDDKATGNPGKPTTDRGLPGLERLHQEEDGDEATEGGSESNSSNDTLQTRSRHASRGDVVLTKSRDGAVNNAKDVVQSGMVRSKSTDGLSTDYSMTDLSAATTHPGLSSINESLQSMSTGLYTDLVRQSLLKQVLQSDHSGKVEIAESLHRIGETLMKQGKYQQATRTLQRCQEVRKIVIGETMATVATVMQEQAEQLETIGLEDKAEQYLQVVEALKMDPCATSLKNAGDTHRLLSIKKQSKSLLQVTDKAQYKKARSLNNRTDRRLNRASREALALSNTLTLLARCNDFDGVDFH